MNEKVKQWLCFGERGTSSNQIVEFMERFPKGTITRTRFSTNPHDPADLYRCIKLLKIAPEYKECLDDMKVISPEWAVLIDHWDELEKMLMEEIPSGHGRAMKTFEFMQILFEKVNVKG